MLGFFKSKSKSITIPDRPCPPTFEQIKEDVEVTDENDIIFRTRSRSDSDSSGEYFDALSELDTSEDEDMEAEQDHVYDQAVELLQMHHRLVSAPHTLETELERLKTVGQEVSEAVDDLRQISRHVSHHSESKEKSPPTTGTSQQKRTKVQH